jgi:hypothetical protein
MTTITEVIPSLPAAPDPATMTRDEFSAAAAAFVLAQKDDLVPSINTWAGQVNTVKGEMVTDAATATTQAGNAAASAASAANQVTLAAAQVTLATNQANAAAASALTAINAPGTNATSTTSDTIATGSTTITIQTGKAFAIGMFVLQASTASPGNYMIGQITAYDSGTGVLTHSGVTSAGGGTYSAWTISLSPEPSGSQPSGPAGSSLFSYTNFGGM